MLQTIKENKLIRLRRLLAVTLCALFTFALFGTMTEETFAASLSKPSITSISADTSKVTVKWKKVKNVTGYQIQYATNKKFTQNKKTVKISKASTVKKTISGLKSGKKYYVRVRCYKNGKKTTYSKWSKVKSVTTKKKASLSSSSKINVTATSKPNGTYRKNKITVKWTKKSVDYYEVEYDVSNKFNTNDADFHKTKKIKASSVNGKNTTTSFTIDNTENYDYLYVRVRGYSTYYDKNTRTYLQKRTGWSNVAKVKLTKCEDDAIAALDNAYAQMNITSNMSDLQKIAQIQKWIDANWHYIRNTDVDSADCSCEDYGFICAHMIVCNKFGGCNDFAYSFRYFANKAGLECEVINGVAISTGVGHYWNYVKVNGAWYHYDCEKHDQIELGKFRRYHNVYNFSSAATAVVNAKQPTGIDSNYAVLNEELGRLKAA